MEEVHKGLQAREHPLLARLLIADEGEDGDVLLDRGHDVLGDYFRHAGEGGQVDQPVKVAGMEDLFPHRFPAVPPPASSTALVASWKRAVAWPFTFSRALTRWTSFSTSSRALSLARLKRTAETTLP